MWVCCFNLASCWPLCDSQVGQGVPQWWEQRSWHPGGVPLLCPVCCHVSTSARTRINHWCLQSYWAGLQIQLLSWHVSRGAGETEMLMHLKWCKMLVFFVLLHMNAVCLWTDAVWCSWALLCSLMTAFVINAWLSPKLPHWPSLPHASYFACLSACLSVCSPVCLWCRFDFEGLENGEEDFLDKSKSWSRSIEDLHRPANQPFYNTLVRSARQSVLRYVRLRWLSCSDLSLLPPRHLLC